MDPKIASVICPLVKRGFAVLTHNRISIGLATGACVRGGLSESERVRTSNA
jgi:hypothetical protein